jgi:hypothetical protein
MPGGAGKWLDIHTEALKGAEVYIVSDNDTPGYKHAIEVDKSLKAAGVDSTLCAPPDEFKDITDYFEAGGDFESLRIWKPEQINLEDKPDDPSGSEEPVEISEPGDEFDDTRRTNQTTPKNRTITLIQNRKSALTTRPHVRYRFGVRHRPTR